MAYDFSGYPRGWFIVGFSDEYRPGTVRKLRYFGQDLICYRGESGRILIRDGHCPHLGAHLGAGGDVVGDDIICPFHRWRFAADGPCVEIPYCDQPIPKRATLKTWESRELNGMIYLWYHPEGDGPDFDTPILPIHESAQWLPWKHSILEIKTHSKEIIENVVDRAHFAPIHNTHIDVFENAFEGEKAIQFNKGTAYPRGGGTDHFELTATYYGPGYQISEMKGFLHSLLVNAHTMIDESTLHLRFGVSLQAGEDPAKLEQYAQAYIDNLTTGFHEDIQIWENKTYREHPLLCASDGPIMKLRKWYAQFYA